MSRTASLYTSSLDWNDSMMVERWLAVPLSIAVGTPASVSASCTWSGYGLGLGLGCGCGCGCESGPPGAGRLAPGAPALRVGCRVPRPGHGLRMLAHVIGVQHGDVVA